MDVALTDMIASVLVVLLPIVVAYLRKAVTSKGVSEDQTEIVFDYIGMELDEMVKSKPDDIKLAKFNKTFKKLHKMWDKEAITTEEMQDFLEELDE